MKFFNDDSSFKRTFGVIVEDYEFSHVSGTKRHIEIFRNLILVKLANMIAAYYFKTHREEIDIWLDSNEFKVAVIELVAARIKITL